MASTSTSALTFACDQPCGIHTQPWVTSSRTEAGKVIEPVAVDTLTSSPSAIPSAVASTGLIIAVGTLAPPVSVGSPFIQELLLRSCRRPTRVRCGLDWARSRSVLAPARASSRTGGATSMRPVGVRRTSGSRGCSGPRSIPLGASRRCCKVRPPSWLPKPSPYGPDRIRRSSIRATPRWGWTASSSSSGVRSWALEAWSLHAADATVKAMRSSICSALGSCPEAMPAAMAANWLSTSVSSFSPSGTSKTAGEKRA